MRAWLTLASGALALCIPGCFSDHGRGDPSDAGPRSDAAFRDAALTCGSEPGFVSRLSCPATVTAGSRATLVVEHSSGLCCPESAAATRLETEGPFSHRVVAEWDRCACCAECACIGPTVRVELETAPLVEGEHTVVAGEQRCVISARPSTCHDAALSGARAPAASLIGQALPVWLRAEGAGCGCAPRGDIGRGRKGELWASVQACDCSDSDPCVDPGYEVTAEVEIDASYAPGIATIGTALGELDVPLFDRASCSTLIDPDDVRILAPTQDLPAGVWAEVDYQAAYCCARPATLADAVRGPPSVRAFQLLDCVQDDCECLPGPPRPLTDLVYLGRMEPGTHRIRVGSVERSVVVPAR